MCTEEVTSSAYITAHRTVSFLQDNSFLHCVAHLAVYYVLMSQHRSSPSILFVFLFDSSVQSLILYLDMEIRAVHDDDHTQS